MQSGAIAGDRAPLRVYAPRFEYRFLGQSNPYPAQDNILSLTIAANVDLSARAAITLSGIAGAAATVNPTPSTLYPTP